MSGFTEPRVGVMGCKISMPDEFPLSMPENTGNMIHGRAPFEMFPGTVYYTDPMFGPGRRNFMDHLNSECTHVVITLANTFRIGQADGTRYVRLQRFLEKCQVPIVIFGLGAQAPRQELPENGLPPEAVTLLKYLGDHTPAIGVRGEFTAAAVEHYAGVRNVFVTGCPSFFSRPPALDELATALAENRRGRPAFNATKLGDPYEKRMAVQAIREDLHWIEATNPAITRYAHAVRRGEKDPKVPAVLRSIALDQGISQARLREYFDARFALFREAPSWYKFNEECVGFTYGTRFHGNMASVLSGVPALWVTHDSRTEEFTHYLRLPAISKEEASSLSVDELRGRMDYATMYAALPELFSRFNDYLRLHQLPAVPLPGSASSPPDVTSLAAAAWRPATAAAMPSERQRLVVRARRKVGRAVRQVRKMMAVRSQ